MQRINRAHIQTYFWLGVSLTLRLAKPLQEGELLRLRCAKNGPDGILGPSCSPAKEGTPKMRPTKADPTNHGFKGCMSICRGREL